MITISVFIALFLPAAIQDFIPCVSGPGISPSSTCCSVCLDLDSDGDIDLRDFAHYTNCMSDQQHEVALNDYCKPVVCWNDGWRQFEERVLVLVNQRRAAGATCGVYGYFAPTTPLQFAPTLRCSSRKHSKDMNDRNFFGHTNPDGQSPGQRMALAGYTGSGWGENIAWGYSTPESVMSAWMSSDGHCANIMRPQWNSIGIGYYKSHIWTQNFGIVE